MSLLFVSCDQSTGALVTSIRIFPPYYSPVVQAITCPEKSL